MGAPAASVPLLESVVGLVGESGCGKSTLGRLAVGLLAPTEGERLWRGRPLAGLPAAEARTQQLKMQMIFQDPYAALNPRMRVADIVGEAPVVHGLVGRGERKEYVAMQLELRGALDLTYLFISHDLGVVRHISDRVVIMYLGRVVESGPTDAIFAAPNHPYTQALLAEAGSIEPKKRTFIPIRGEIPSPLDPPPGCHFHPRCPKAMPQCRERAPALVPVAPDRSSACHLNDAGGNTTGLAT